MDGRTVIRFLKERGWIELRSKGSHVQLGKGTARTTVPVHGKSDLKIGTLKKIERDTNEKFH